MKNNNNNKKQTKNNTLWVYDAEANKCGVHREGFIENIIVNSVCYQIGFVSCYGY